MNNLSVNAMQSGCNSESPHSVSDASAKHESSNLILLRWNDSESFLSKQIKKLWSKMEMADVLLSCEGRFLRAHKTILSLWSPYFENLLQETSNCKESAFPVIVFRDTLAVDLELILQFMYQGQVFVAQQDAERFLKTAEFLQVAGLSEQVRSSTAAVIAPSDKDNPVSNREPSRGPETQKTAKTITTPNPTRILTFSKGSSIKPPANLGTSNEKYTKDVRPPQQKESSSEEFSSVDCAGQHPDIQNISASEQNTLSSMPAPVEAFTSSFLTSMQTTYSTITGGTVQNIRSVTDGDILLNQALHYPMEPIPMHEVQEAMAAASAESSSTITPVMLLSINQQASYPEPERDRNDNISANNSLFASTSTMSNYASYIVPEMEHQYASQMCEPGTISFSEAYEQTPNHQHQGQIVEIVQEQHSAGGERVSGHQLQSLPEKCNKVKNPGAFVKIEKSVVINSNSNHERAPAMYVPCARCGKQVKEQSLKTHMKRTHLAEGVTFVPCPICPKKLSSKGVYYKHMFCHRQRGEIPPKVPKVKAQKPKTVKRPRIAKQPKMKQSQRDNPTSNAEVVVYKGDERRSYEDQSAGEHDPGPRPSPSSVIYQPVMQNNLRGANADITISTHNQYQQQQNYQYVQL